ncbi:MAG TPA: hypothetical protein VGZ73_01870 [Bryobacteraceae bacterium]|jgi:hypothetical protein|nr:hypothetical protein [Bryobacteraceae bacterium]
MRQTNSLLRAHLADIQRLAGNGSSDGLLRRKLARLLRYEMQDREVRTEFLIRIAGLLEHLGTGAEKRVRTSPPWRVRKSSARA